MTGGSPRRRVLRALGLATLALGLPRPGPARQDLVVRTDRHRVRVRVLVEGLEHPWGLAFLPDGRILLTERPGRLRLVENGRLEPPLAGVPEVVARGQGGLLDVAIHPRYPAPAWVYLSYAAPGGGGAGTEVARARLGPGRLEDLEVIFRQEPKSRSDIHFGGRLVFDRTGRLHVTLGDRGQRERAQELGDLRGKVVRLEDDGRVPADNPFVGRAGARAEVFTYGHRNVQGAALHPGTGHVWTHEHGPQGGDEVNLLRAGGNYGWPVITFGREYGTGAVIGQGTARPDVVPPVHVWIPSIAPSGMTFCAGDRLPGWRGHLFVGALRDRCLVRLELDGPGVVREERMLAGVLGRIRDVRSGPDGDLYLLTDESAGVLARLEPADS